MSDILRVSTQEFSPSYVSSKNTVLYFILKRWLDCALAAVLIVMLSPLMLLAAVLIKLDSPGPIFFKQKRVGARRIFKEGRWSWLVVNFDCLKFRTMKHGVSSTLHQAYVTALIQNDVKKMDEIQHSKQSIHKLMNDPRITRIGRVLRKYSIDELPQFINVLRGQMSLVGPRPAIEYEVNQYKSWHLMRLNALPGITGLQQIKARCTSDFDNQVAYDLEYIENQSLWLDLKIMAMTPFEILRHRGAC